MDIEKYKKDVMDAIEGLKEVEGGDMEEKIDEVMETVGKTMDDMNTDHEKAVEEAKESGGDDD